MFVRAREEITWKMRPYKKNASIVYNMHIYCRRQVTVLVYTLNPLLL